MMSFPIIAMVLFSYYGDLFSMLIMHFPAPSCWQQHLSFETGYLPSLLLSAKLTFEVAIILIFKHAAMSCLSGNSGKLALTQAVLEFWKAKMISKIEEHFTATYSEYAIEQFISFLVNTTISRYSMSIEIVADITFKASE